MLKAFFLYAINRKILKQVVFPFTVLIIHLLLFSMVKAQTPRPNIVLIVSDDMNWKMSDFYAPDTFIHTPNIDRIANEGARMKYYSTNSLCIPGRTSLLTGKYGHETGAMNNDSFPVQSLMTVPKILHARGYHTALCGKWMLGDNQPKPEFDYWLWCPNATSYYNDTVKYFDSSLAVNGHITDFLADSVVQLISRIDTPFFLLVTFNAPHSPFIPRVEDTAMYDSDSFTLPQNWAAFYENYPSFLYTAQTHPITTYNEYQHEMKEYYALFHSVEDATGKIYDSLEANDLLSNTMLIYTNDNGYLMGEHRIRGKSHPYDDCMRMPLFIRYPPWFAPGTVIDSSFTLNIDVAPTMLEAAGVPDTFVMEGTSVHDVLTSQFKRTQFYYEQSPDHEDSFPTLRSFRDALFQYNRYYCTDTTEELFNMVNDPYQKKNLIHHYLYQDTLNIYRQKLDSARAAESDTASFLICNCQILNPVFVHAPPVLSATHINATCGGANGSISVTTTGGIPPYSFLWNTGDTTEDLSNLAPMLYHLTVTDAEGNQDAVNVNILNTSNAPTVSETHINATLANANGSINITVNGTAPPYSYLWNMGATTQDLMNLLPAVYSMTVTDNGGCAVSLSIIITTSYDDPAPADSASAVADSLGLLNGSFISEENDFGEMTLWPVPASEVLNIESKSMTGSCRLTVMNCLGERVLDHHINFSGAAMPNLNVASLAGGFYFLMLTNGNHVMRGSFVVMH